MDPTEKPDSGSGDFHSTPFGGDNNNSTHVQPAPPLKTQGGLPGEQEDPRLC